METVAKLIKESIPNYFRDLPVPQSFSGIFHLGGSELLKLGPLLTLLTGSTYLTWRYLTQSDSISETGSSKVNLNVQKDCPKVVDTCDIEDISKPGEKKVYCRCWRSKKFPLCDGSHVQHNEQTGDNVGPLIVINKK